MSQKQSSFTTLSSDKMASVFGKGVVTLRVVNTKMDTPIPPRLLFTATELRQQLENHPVVTWLVKEHENATNFTTERYDLINKIMGWNNDAGSVRQSHSGDTLSVLYGSSIYDEHSASDTGGSCVSTSSRSVWNAEAKRGTSRPPSETDSERTEFRFDPDRVTDVDPDDPWLQSLQQKKIAQESENKQPTPGPNDSFLQALKLKRVIEGNSSSQPSQSPHDTLPVNARPERNGIRVRRCRCWWCAVSTNWTEKTMTVLMGIGVMALWALFFYEIVNVIMHDFSTKTQSASLGLTVVEI